jgi:hypothetical protein
MTQTLDAKAFELKQFNSCSDLSKTMEDIVKKQYLRDNFGGGMLDDAPMLMDMKGGMMPTTSSAMPESGVRSEAVSAPSADMGGGFSETNVQVAGVDEADTIKTDGKYVYYVNMTTRKVQISEVRLRYRQ